MASPFAISRSQIILAVCLPLGVLVGYFLANAEDLGSIVALTLVLGVLSVPILMKWYHPLLVVGWNAAIQPIFIPGRPALWMVIAFFGFLFAALNRSTHAEAKFIDVRSIRTPLLLLFGVVITTAWLRGGLGVRSLGSGTYGGRSYYYIIAAILGYLALTSRRIPRHRAATAVGLFFLTGVTALIPNLAHLGGPALDFVYYVFAPVFSFEQGSSAGGLDNQIVRMNGLSVVCWALSAWALSRRGYRGLFSLNDPLGLLALGLSLAASLFCGFRSMFIFVVLLLVAQFYFEGLMRGKTLVMAVGVMILGLAMALPFTERLPHVVQRTISFLPIDVSHVARDTAEASSEWRLNMWQEVLPLIPDHLLLGRGYSVDPTELHFTTENAQRGFAKPWNWAILTSSFHNGPLSLIIPLGIWGVAAFAWFVAATLRYMLWAARQGDPDLRSANTTILALFVARLVLFAFVFGNLPTDLYIFAGLAGLSVSLNGPRHMRTPIETGEKASFNDEQKLAARRG